MYLKLVIVEDEEIIRKGLSLAINWLDMGLAVVGCAKDGLEGLEMIYEKKPDIVLTDIKMPRLSGLKMIEQASKKLDFYALVLTSYSEFEFAKKAINIGVVEYLLKPLDEEELKKTIEKIRAKIAYNNKYKNIEQISKEKIISSCDEWKIFESARESQNPYIKATYEFIKNHYSEKISINQVADVLSLSPSYLSRKLKKHLNTGFVDLLNQYRIKKALIMLNETNKKVYEISQELGFSEYKHFCTVFKKYTKFTPTEFSKKGGFALLREK